VGAALLTQEGSIYTGVNIENPSLMLTVCAERVALLKALSEGRRSFKALAVLSEAFQEPCLPCGACRQLLWEFAPALTLVLPYSGGTEVLALRELLPRPFRRP
jgi:cytidine deaminase